MAITPFSDLSLEAVLAQFQNLKGGKRLRQAIAKFGEALAARDTYKNSPLLLSADAALSLAGAVDIELVGQNLLVPSQDAAKQAVATLAVFGTVVSGNYVTVYARVPGKIGNNIELTINTPGAAATVDSDEATDTPKVAWTPATGDVDASITDLNATSKLVFAVKTGTGGTLASQTATLLEDGVGEGVKLCLGTKCFQDASAAGATFIGSANGTYIKEWWEDRVCLHIDEADLVVGEAVPTGRNALTAVESHLLLRLEYTRPLYEVHFPLAVAA